MDCLRVDCSEFFMPRSLTWSFYVVSNHWTLFAKRCLWLKSESEFLCRLMYVFYAFYECKQFRVIAKRSQVSWLEKITSLSLSAIMNAYRISCQKSYICALSQLHNWWGHCWIVEQLTIAKCIGATCSVTQFARPMPCAQFFKTFDGRILVVVISFISSSLASHYFSTDT